MIRIGLIILVCFAVLSCKTNQTPNSSDNIEQSKLATAVDINASDNAISLLNFIYSIKGIHTLSGQHNVPKYMSVFTDSIYLLTGKKPAIWGGDFGFSDERHDTDNIKYRENLIREIKKQHKEGAIINLCYHQANPIEGEPCLFDPGVIYKLSDEQWEDLLTPGTEIYNNWKNQMDIFAGYLKELKEAKIPILFRPYHEMNGSWFWWGGRPGKDGFQALWIQLFEYYTKHHELNNLLWVWSSDRPWEGVEDYYPGDQYVDILGCDIYPLPDTNIVFRQEWYDRIQNLAGEKPFGITEHSVLPTKNEFINQSGFVWFLSWNNMVIQGNKLNRLKEVYNSEQVLTLDELPKH